MARVPTREEILARLESGEGVGVDADLAVFAEDGNFVVEFLPGPDPLDPAGLSAEQVRQLNEEGELAEYFETPGEAADFYLFLRDKAGVSATRSRLPRREASAVTPPSAALPSLPAVGDDTFEREVLQANQPVVLFCWAPWSGPDRQMIPVVEQVAAALSAVRFVAVNVEDNPGVLALAALQSLPTILCFRKGQEVRRIVGIHHEAELLAFVQEAVS
jgi:thiol-disulfide isomerase/thioredoxin